MYAPDMSGDEIMKSAEARLQAMGIFQTTAIMGWSLSTRKMNHTHYDLSLTSHVGAVVLMLASTMS